MAYWNLWVTFLKIGALCFGGGYAMIPFFEKEIALNHWAAAGDYQKIIALAQVLPGPFAIDSSTYIGYKVAGLGGAILASIALSLPAFLALLLISRYYSQFKTNTNIQLGLRGMRPVVIALLISAAYIIGLKPLLPTQGSWFSLTTLKASVLILAGFLLLKYTKIKPIWFIALFAIIGIVFF